MSTIQTSKRMTSRRQHSSLTMASKTSCGCNSFTRVPRAFGRVPRAGSGDHLDTGTGTSGLWAKVLDCHVHLPSPLGARAGGKLCQHGCCRVLQCEYVTGCCIFNRLSVYSARWVIHLFIHLFMLIKMSLWAVINLSVHYPLMCHCINFLVYYLFVDCFKIYGWQLFVYLLIVRWCVSLFLCLFIYLFNYLCVYVCLFIYVLLNSCFYLPQKNKKSSYCFTCWISIIHFIFYRIQNNV